MASARERFLLLMGPGWFCGITTGDWFKLLYQNGFRVDPIYWPRMLGIFTYSLLNSLVAWPEKLIYDRKIAATPVERPLFVLGHPRSGTTHLQNLLSLDDRFGHPNFFQVNYPRTFILGESWGSKILKYFVPSHRFMDNMSQHVGVPHEEEWALCNMTGESPYVGWSFPRRLDHYEKFWTLRELPEKDIRRFQDAMLYFLRKLTLKHKKPLILKSPPHTSRIKYLLEIFPDARFVSIYRNPYDVFQSTQNLWAKVRPFCQLQKPVGIDVDERILQQYRNVYEAYFADVHLIPPENFHEIRYEDLEVDPLHELRQTYEKLSLPSFSEIEPKVKQYLSTVADYRKNQYRGIPPAMKARIAQEWSMCFEEWGYPRELEHEPSSVTV